MNRQLASVGSNAQRVPGASMLGGRWLGGALLGIWLSACSHGPQVRPAQLAAVQTLEMEPLQLEVGRGGAEAEVFDASTLFAEGGQHMDADRYADAAASYERLVKNFPDSPYAAPALYNAALSYEGLDRFADAAERYRKVLDEHSGSKQEKDALFRLGACYAETGRWVASGEVYTQAVRRTDLTLGDRLEATARLGLAHFEVNDLQVAEQHFTQAVEQFKAQRDSERLETCLTTRRPSESVSVTT